MRELNIKEQAKVGVQGRDLKSMVFWNMRARRGREPREAIQRPQNSVTPNNAVGIPGRVPAKT